MPPMGIQGMKVRHFARGLWEHEPTSLTLGCKRLQSLAPKLTTPAAAAAGNAVDLKSFIKPESGPTKPGSSDFKKRESVHHQVEAQPGGTRWNPTQEQIGILEMLYRGGMRTPNAQQIEQITAQLGKYGKIEGKNVFYWFQNHKARERQKQKRNSQGLSHTAKALPSSFSSTTTCVELSIPKRDGVEEELGGTTKRKCRSWALDHRYCREEEDNGFCTGGGAEDRTLKLFPLHPEGRS